MTVLELSHSVPLRTSELPQNWLWYLQLLVCSTSPPSVTLKVNLRVWSNCLVHNNSVGATTKILKSKKSKEINHFYWEPSCPWHTLLGRVDLVVYSKASYVSVSSLWHHLFSSFSSFSFSEEHDGEEHRRWSLNAQIQIQALPLVTPGKSHLISLYWISLCVK